MLDRFCLSLLALILLVAYGLCNPPHRPQIECDEAEPIPCLFWCCPQDTICCPSELCCN